MITLGSKLWDRTLPHVLEPFPEEWLPGLLMRADELNGWTTHTTLEIVHEEVPLDWHWRMIWAVTGENFPFETLAEVLHLTAPQVEATTWKQECGRYYTRQYPTAAEISALATARICPACVAEHHLLRRDLYFPLVLFCPVHGIALCTHCTCGERIQFAKRYSKPFCCVRCHQPWSDLPRCQGTGEELTENTYRLACYETVLTYDARLLAAFVVARAENWLRIQARREPRYRSDYHICQYEAGRLPASLPTAERLSHLMIQMHCSLADIACLVGSHLSSPIACLHPWCELYGEVNHANILPYHPWRTYPRWYCCRCGTVLTSRCIWESPLPLPHHKPAGVVYPEESEYAVMQDELAWVKKRITAQCRQAAKEGKKLDVQRIIHLSLLTQDHPRWHAPQLGLEDIVEHWQKSSPITTEEEGSVI